MTGRLVVNVRMDLSLSEKIEEVVWFAGSEKMAEMLDEGVGRKRGKLLMRMEYLWMGNRIEKFVVYTHCPETDQLVGY